MDLIADKPDLGAVILSLAFSLSIDACGSTAVYRQRRLLIMGGLMMKKDGIWTVPSGMERYVLHTPM